jgi:hypothetical protein
MAAKDNIHIVIMKQRNPVIYNILPGRNLPKTIGKRRLVKINDFPFISGGLKLFIKPHIMGSVQMFCIKADILYVSIAKGIPSVFCPIILQREMFEKFIAGGSFQVSWFPIAGNSGRSLFHRLSCAWPGHGSRINALHQFVENEYMKAEEYDRYLNDPADFNIRFRLPRFFGLLQPLAKLPPLDTIVYSLL